MDFNQRCPGDSWLVPFWVGSRLLEDPAYSDSLAVRWAQLAHEPAEHRPVGSTGRLGRYAP